MAPVLLLLLSVSGLVLIVAFCRLLVRWFSFPCQFCGAKMKEFTQLTPEAQAGLLLYFKKVEKRVPDTSAIFTCTQCRYVQDDFSGEKLSRDIDSGGCRLFCKACGHLLLRCDPELGGIECPECGARFRWEQHKSSGFYFFTPHSRGKLLAKPPPGIVDY